MENSARLLRYARPFTNEQQQQQTMQVPEACFTPAEDAITQEGEVRSRFWTGVRSVPYPGWSEDLGDAAYTDRHLQYLAAQEELDMENGTIQIRYLFVYAFPMDAMEAYMDAGFPIDGYIAPEIPENLVDCARLCTQVAANEWRYPDMNFRELGHLPVIRVPPRLVVCFGERGSGKSHCLETHSDIEDTRVLALDDFTGDATTFKQFQYALFENGDPAIEEVRISSDFFPGEWFDMKETQFQRLKKQIVEVHQHVKHLNVWYHVKYVSTKKLCALDAFKAENYGPVRDHVHGLGTIIMDGRANWMVPAEPSEEDLMLTQ